MDSDRPRWRSRAWLLAAAVPAMLGLALVTVGVNARAVSLIAPAGAGGATAMVLVWAVARTRAQRRRYEDELEAWAAERSRHAERLRIAADLHDLVSHGLGLITVRAATARGVTGPDGEDERAAALADIEQTSRGTTTELRRMLTVLRTPAATPLHPADTLDDLPGIVQDACAAGLAARLDVADLGEVSPGGQLTVCAVVREAVHNSLRHAGPTSARIDVHRDEEAIIVTVQDDGPGEGWNPRPGAGHGLDGLRERVTALGGTVRAGHERDGFRVTARIPDRDRS